MKCKLLPFSTVTAVRSSLIGISAAAICLFAASSASAAPAANYTPISVPPPVALLAACIANGNYCSSDADCCSHRCFAVKTGVFRCVGKKFR